MFLLQWNANGILSRSPDLKHIVSNFPPKIISIQESHLRPYHTYKLNGYKCFRFDFCGGNRLSGGTCIFVHNSYPATKLNLNSCNLQAVAVSIKTPEFHKTPISICSVYIPPNHTITSDDLESLFKNLPSPYIVSGDFNAHNPIWGSSTTNNRGNVINQFITRNDTFLLNSGKPTHFSSANGTFSAIDLTFCSPSIAHLLHWEPQNDLHFSDHFPINISLVNTNPQIKQKTPKWLVQKADWDKFQRHFQIPMPLNTELDLLLEDLVKAILHAASNSIPKTSVNVPNRKVPWWCPEIKLAIKNRKRALRAFKKRPTDANLIEFKKKRSQARRIILEKKRQSWKDFMCSITSNTSVQESWKKIKILKGSYVFTPIEFLLRGNNTVTSPSDIANTLAQQFSTASSTNSYKQTFLRVKQQSERDPINISSNNLEPYNTLFTMAELQHCLKNNIRNSSPGPDDIHPFMIKNLPENGLSYILDMYNKIWVNDAFPSSWKKATIVPILKPEKDPTQPSNYRPISLTCVLCKILEKMVSKRLNWFLQDNQIISINQSGFRKKRSTVDHLLDLTQDIQTAFSNRENLYAIFFDLEKAYDKAWRHKILLKLSEIGIKGHLAFFIKNFLTDRSFQVRVLNTYSPEQTIKNGVPQGSVLSTTLFILLIDDIAKIINPPITLRTFADDINISVRTRDPVVAQGILQTALNSIGDWADNNGLSFSHSKTHCVNFSRKRKIQVNPILTLQGHQLEYKDNIRFLGLIFDRRLTWKPHIIKLKSELIKGLNLLKILKNPTFNPSRKQLLNVFRSLIRSKIDYGAPAYLSASKSLLENLNVIQNSALRLCIGALRSTPISSLHCEAPEMPLPFRRSLISNKFLCSVIGNPNHPIGLKIQKHLQTKSIPIHKPISEFLQLVDVHQIPVNSTVVEHTQKKPMWKLTPPDIITDLTDYPKTKCAPTVIKQHFHSILAQYENFVLCFMDGSKIENKHTGYAFTVHTNTFSFKLNNFYSNFTAELLAIFHCLVYIKNEMSTVNNKFLILTDSLSSLQSLQNIFSDHLIVELIQNLHNDLMHSNITTKFMFIPSHVGITGNDTVDLLAKSATNQSPFKFLIRTDMKKFFHQISLQEWQSEWSEQTSNKLIIIIITGSQPLATVLPLLEHTTVLCPVSQLLH